MTLEQLIQEAVDKYQEAEKLVIKAVDELNSASGTIWINQKSPVNNKPNPIQYKIDRLKAILKIPEVLRKQIK